MKFCQRLEETRVGYLTQECPINTCLCEEIPLKLSWGECFLLIKHTSWLCERDSGIYFSVKTRNCPFSQLLQPALYCSMCCSDKVHRRCNEFQDLLFILSCRVQSTFTNYILPSSLSFWFSIVYKLHHGGVRSSILRRVSLLSASIVVEVIDQLLLALLHLPTRFLAQFVCLPSVGLFESQTLVSRL